MAKYFVTPELAETIKAIRVQNKISSKSLASHIEKSPSYVSKLESGNIKCIQEDELTKIIDFIVDHNITFEEKINSLIKTLSVKYSPNELENQVWLINYDTVLRQIPVPEELVDFINESILQANITLEYLITRVNANEVLDKNIVDDDTYPFNEWCVTELPAEPVYHFIKMNLDIGAIKRLLSKEVKTSNYVSMLSLLICLEKIRKFGEKVDIDEDVYHEIYRTATSTLKQHKFYTLSHKNALVQTASSEEDLQTILTTFDQANLNTINKILTIFQIMSEMNIVQANKQFEAFLKNLDWDCGFIMKVASMDFSKLDDASYTTKRNIIHEIESILVNYQSLPDNKKNIETY